jgi:hypothetical protein
MALTQREEISSVIDRGGGSIANLNKTLEERLASGTPAPGAPPSESK